MSQLGIDPISRLFDAMLYMSKSESTHNYSLSLCFAYQIVMMAMSSYISVMRELLEPRGGREVKRLLSKKNELAPMVQIPSGSDVNRLPESFTLYMASCTNDDGRLES